MFLSHFHSIHTLSLPFFALRNRFEKTWCRAGFVKPVSKRFKMFWNRFKCACECAKPVSCGHVKLIVFACMNFIICITARFRTHASWWQNRLAWRTTVVTACVAVIRGLTVEGQGYCPSNVFSDWWVMPICITLSSYLSSPTGLSCSQNERANQKQQDISRTLRRWFSDRWRRLVLWETLALNSRPLERYLDNFCHCM